MCSHTFSVSVLGIKEKQLAEGSAYSDMGPMGSMEIVVPASVITKILNVGKTIHCSGVMISTTPTMHSYKKQLQMIVHLLCLIPSKWVIWWSLRIPAYQKQHGPRVMAFFSQPLDLEDSYGMLQGILTIRHYPLVPVALFPPKSSIKIRREPRHW